MSFATIHTPSLELPKINHIILNLHAKECSCMVAVLMSNFDLDAISISQKPKHESCRGVS